jgi:hypothetical protein
MLRIALDASGRSRLGVAGCGSVGKDSDTSRPSSNRQAQLDREEHPKRRRAPQSKATRRNRKPCSRPGCAAPFGVRCSASLWMLLAGPASVRRVATESGMTRLLSAIKQPTSTAGPRRASKAAQSAAVQSRAPQSKAMRLNAPQPEAMFPPWVRSTLWSAMLRIALDASDRSESPVAPSRCAYSRIKHRRPRCCLLFLTSQPSALSPVFGESTALGLLGFCGTVAQAVVIAPVLVEISPPQRVASITVSNPDGDPISYQAQALSWQQAAGADQYEPTDQLIVVPRSPRSRQVAADLPRHHALAARTAGNGLPAGP